MEREFSLSKDLGEILAAYDFSFGPLFNLSPKLRLHSALAYKDSNLEGEDFYDIYIGGTVKKACDIFKALNFKGELLLVHDMAFGQARREEDFIESILLGPRAREEYTYEWSDPNDQEVFKARRIIYRVEGLNLEELFLQISLSDFAGAYDLASSIFIIDLDSKTIFYLYDDRGLYVMAQDEKILQDLWRSRPGDFFEDCQDFKIRIKNLYWIDGSLDNREDLCLHGDLEIRLNNKIIEYSPTVSAAGLRLLRSLFKDHTASSGGQLFPCCGNTIIAREDGKKVDILGCNEGLDWFVRHHNGLVTIGADEDLKTTYYYLQYKREVLEFADHIEDFYRESPRILPDDQLDRKGYLSFWKEWMDLREKAL